MKLAEIRYKNCPMSMGRAGEPLLCSGVDCAALRIIQSVEIVYGGIEDNPGDGWREIQKPWPTGRGQWERDLPEHEWTVECGMTPAPKE